MQNNTTPILLPTDRGVRIIPACSIVRIEACSNYSKLFFDNAKPLTVAKVLHWFEDKLEQQFFYRIHKTHIVNSQFISAISSDNNILTLANGEQLKISRRRKERVLRLLA
jgi:two-component system, LytTR family, response regulator